MPMNDSVITVDNIGKCYRIGLKDQTHDNMASAIFAFLKSPINNYRKYRSLYRFDAVETDGSDNSNSNCNSTDVIWALRNVSFEVKRGEILGIIGRNGAGKSTLLKILSRITEPTVGCAEIRGRVASLLEVGTGFHAELTGRENVYLNGTVLGMKKTEVDRTFDEIVDFSGVEKFIDTPVKRYSSGMKVRLAFAVAAHLEPEILIVDEVLAVGDSEFQRKCVGRMENISREGRTVLFVSHNMGVINQFCPTAILLQNGMIADKGPSKDVVQRYLSILFSATGNLDLSNVEGRKGDGRMKFMAVYLQDEAGKCINLPIAGHPLDIVFEYESYEELRRVSITFTVFNHLGIAVTNCHVDSCGHRPSLSEGKGKIVCHIPKLPLPQGQYKIAVAAHDSEGQIDYIPSSCVFEVETSDFFPTSFFPPIRYSTALVEHSWEFLTKARS